MAKARVEWREQPPKLTPSKLVFIDESAVKTNMTRHFGRACYFRHNGYFQSA